MIFTARRCAEPARTTPKCLIFQWIGQSFDTCDDCDQPLEKHLYHPPYGSERPLFHIKQYDRRDLYWHWAPVGSFVKPRE